MRADNRERNWREESGKAERALVTITPSEIAFEAVWKTQAVIRNERALE
jgi:hypothetical protein